MGPIENLLMEIAIILVAGVGLGLLLLAVLALLAAMFRAHDYPVLPPRPDRLQQVCDCIEAEKGHAKLEGAKEAMEDLLDWAENHGYAPPPSACGNWDERRLG